LVTDSDSHKNVTKEELLRPLSAFPWIEDVSNSKSRPGSLKKSKGGGRGEGGASETERADAGSSADAAGSSGGGKIGSKAANVFKVRTVLFFSVVDWTVRYPANVL
jgi:hypothetical protein